MKMVKLILDEQYKMLQTNILEYFEFKEISNVH